MATRRIADARVRGSRFAFGIDSIGVYAARYGLLWQTPVEPLLAELSPWTTDWPRSMLLAADHAASTSAAWPARVARRRPDSAR